jgi:integrase
MELFDGKENSTLNPMLSLELLTVKQVTHLLHMHPTTVRAQAVCGKLPATKPGKGWRFIGVDLVAWLRAQYRRAVSVDQEKLCHHSTEDLIVNIGGLLSRSQVAERYEFLLKWPPAKPAKEWADKVQHEAWQQERLGNKPKHLWDEAVVKWCEESTKKTLHKDVSKFQWFNTYLGGVLLSDITKAKVEEIAQAKKKEASASTANRYLEVIRAVLRRAVHEWEWIDKLSKIRMYPEPKRRVRFLTVAEAKTLLSRLPKHQRYLMKLALATGLRKSNITQLEWSQVSLEHRMAWIHADQAKGGESIAIPLNNVALSVLKKQCGKHPLHVFTYKGRPIKQVNTKAWRKALAEVGITNFRWHDLWHTWASWLVMEGATLSELQELGGWQTPEMVRRYAHFSVKHLRRVSSTLDNVIYG